MRHVHSLKNLALDSAFLTVGTFDGVHRGHAALIKAMLSASRQAGVPAVALTFQPHPAIVLGRRSGSFCLNTADERAGLLLDCGLDWVITEPFTLELADVTATEFMQRLKKHLGLSALWIGHDFALGKGREGTEHFLRTLGKQMDFDVQAVEAFQDEGVISSTRIRSLLWDGEVGQAANLLGRPYSLAGRVVPGDQRGRTIGIPTANLDVDQFKLVPSSGVYACSAEVDGQNYRAAVNIGVRPTFDGSSTVQHVEAHLLDFSADLYEKSIRINFFERLRGEQRFSGVAELVAQIHADIQRTREIVTSK